MKFLHAPQHVGQYIGHNLDAVASLKPRSVGFTEMDSGPVNPATQMRRSLRGYRIFASETRNGHAWDVPMALRTGPFCQVVGHALLPLSPKVGDKGTGNDRWMTVVRFRRFGLKVAHLQLHLDADIQDKTTGEMRDNEQVRVTERGVQIVEERIAALRAAGYQVVVSGDWNWRAAGVDGKRRWTAEWDYSPLAVAQRQRMESYGDGLDWMLWTRGLTGSVRSIPRGTAFNRSDHPWLEGRLRRRLLKRPQK